MLNSKNSSKKEYKISFIFFGTSHFSAQILKFLFEKGVVPLAIVTRPDRPRGRSLSISPPPVKETALALNLSIPIFQPEKASTPEFEEVLKEFGADLFIVVAYGEILKQNILSLPRLGAINVHASLLPKYRGAAPMQRCLMNGEKKTGITIMEMVLQMDAGDIIKSVEIKIPETMTYGELEEKLCHLACPALLEVIHTFQKGGIQKTPQNPKEVTFAPKITPEEEEIKWTKDASWLHNLIRALSPFPGAWCWLQVGKEKKRLKIKRTQVVSEMSGVPGTILRFGKEGFVVACGKGALCLLEVQLEGKKSIKAEDFIKGMNQNISFSI